MPRSASTLLPTLASSFFRPAFLVMLTLRSSTQYMWSGVGPLVYSGNTYLGIGSLGQMGPISEGVEVKAEGTSLTLSGIDPALLNDCLTDIKVGAPAKIWFTALNVANHIIGTPYLLFSGQVDKPSITTGVETISISLALETRMFNLQRATQRRYTSADQRVLYPDDTGFNSVESLSDVALRWGR